MLFISYNDRIKSFIDVKRPQEEVSEISLSYLLCSLTKGWLSWSFSTDSSPEPELFTNTQMIEENRKLVNAAR